MTNTRRANRYFLLAIAVFGWFAVGVQVAWTISVATHGGHRLAYRLINLCSFFTMLTNVWIALLASVALSRPRAGNVLTRPATMSAAAVYIFTVGLVYSLFLRASWHPTGIFRVSDHILHDLIPVLYIFYWFMFVPKGTLKWPQPLNWLIYPLLYFGYVLMRGASTGFYPYGFVNVKAHGYPKILAISLVFLAWFLLLGLIAVAVDKFLALPADVRRAHIQRALRGKRGASAGRKWWLPDM